MSSCTALITKTTPREDSPTEVNTPSNEALVMSPTSKIYFHDDQDSNSSCELNSEDEKFPQLMENYLEVSISTFNDTYFQSSDSKEDITKKRKRSKILDPSSWQKHKMKRQKFENKHPKPAKCLKCRFKCSEKIEPDYREIICKNYWGCDFKSRKNFILNHINSHAPERRRQKSESTRKARIDSKSYFLISKSNNKVRVCKDFFTRTLCISKDVIEHTFKNKGEGDLYAAEDKRGKKEPHNKTKLEDIKKVKIHIESFPNIKYTIENSSSFMEDPKQSIPNMYSHYKEVCYSDGSKPVSLVIYRRIFYN